LVDKLLKKQEKREKVDTTAGVLGDDRFSKMFEDEDYAVDETSREFQVLNPSTIINPHAPTDASMPSRYKADSDSEGSDKEDSDEEIMQMRVSSTQGGSSARDTALGSREQKSGRSDKASRGAGGGERSVTFMPASKKKGHDEEDEEAAPPPRKPMAGRRSASSNTFRKM
jgi:ribosome biogenesis protein ENP2